MSPLELENFLHREIPITEAMALEVAALGPWHIALTAPLAPNRNDKGTGFAGSLGSVLTLSAWSLLHTKLNAENLDCQLMIHKCEHQYLLPVGSDIMAHCQLDKGPWDQFVAQLRREGRARIATVSVISRNETICVRMVGSFVAVRN